MGKNPLALAGEYVNDFRKDKRSPIAAFVRKHDAPLYLIVLAITFVLRLTTGTEASWLLLFVEIVALMIANIDREAEILELQGKLIEMVATKEDDDA